MAPLLIPGNGSEDRHRKEENGYGHNKKEILFDGWYYDVTEFVRRHPGGSIIEYYTKPGEDATEPIQQFHNRSIKKVTAIMKSLKRRAAEEAKLDEEVAKKNRVLTEDFTKLYLELEKEGLFRPSYFHVAYRIFELVAMVILGYYCIVASSSYFVWAVGCFILGIAHGRSGWVQHEGGHHSLTGKPRVDRMLQTVVMGIGLGLSATWWRRSHNKHHAMPQRLKHDLDLATLPLVAYNTRVVEDDPKKGQTFLIRYQKYLFVPFDTFLGMLVWQFYINPRQLLKYRTYPEIVCIGLRYYLFTFVGFWPWLISDWIGSIYLFFNFALSHSHLPVTSEPTHWVEYGLTHTVDVEQTPWCDWWMCFLNYQIEHHLFPTMPQFRLPKIAPRVRALAEKHGLPYHVLTYNQAVFTTLNNFGEVADELQKVK